VGIVAGRSRLQNRRMRSIGLTPEGVDIDVAFIRIDERGLRRVSPDSLTMNNEIPHFGAQP